MYKQTHAAQTHVAQGSTVYTEVYDKHISIGNLSKLPVITTVTVLMTTLETILIMTSYSLNAYYGQMLC